MKTVGVRELQKRLKECLQVSQTEGVVITRNGKPTSLLIGVEGAEWEDLVPQAAPEFWKVIRERRNEESVSEEEMRRRVLGRPRKRSGA